MTSYDVVAIGAGAAGIAAARRLQQAGRAVKLIEARERLGGRGWTVRDRSGALDLGCGWLHSAPDNEWSDIARARGFTLDTATPPWAKPALEHGFPAEAQRDFRAEIDALFARIAAAGETEPDRAAATLIAPGTRWRALMDAVSTWINGVEFDRLSVADFRRYRDTGINWRVAEGFGALIAAQADGLDVALETAATRIDHSGRTLRIETTRGTLEARAAIVTVPTDLLAAGAIDFSPPLPDKIAAAGALPLGLADKAFLRVAKPGDLPVERRAYGAIDGPTASYHLRPFGSDLIEIYVGGALARALEADGALFAFAVDQLVSLFGNDMRARLSPVAASAWARDPFARGSYSYAEVGCADQRAALAAPHEDRLFFAGEACSRHDFSTAHGAYRTGVAAAEQAIAALAHVP